MQPSRIKSTRQENFRDKKFVIDFVFQTKWLPKKWILPRKTGIRTFLKRCNQKTDLLAPTCAYPMSQVVKTLKFGCSISSSPPPREKRSSTAFPRNFFIKKVKKRLKFLIKNTKISDRKNMTAFKASAFANIPGVFQIFLVFLEIWKISTASRDFVNIPNEKN